MEAFVQEWWNWVISILWPKYSELAEHDAPSSDFLYIAVSYDGTWMHQCFRSNICAGFVINCVIGFVIDFVLLNRNCKTCITHKKAMSPEAFAEWEVTHALLCKNYFDGKSGAMEAEGAIRMWSFLNSMVRDTNSSLEMVIRRPSMTSVRSIMAVDWTMSQLRRRNV